MSEVHNFGVEPITCHAWNKTNHEVALSLNSAEVKIYKKNGNGWLESATMTEHGQRVTSIDWAPTSNRIVTCGADRNAYVWTYTRGKWMPTLVILRINRAATYVRWSPKENKFAVGSGARSISVCYFEEDNDWWVSKHIKKSIRSTVTSLDWHPNNVLLASGSTDFKAKVFSGYIKEIEEKPARTPWSEGKVTFGNLLAEFSNSIGGWVHAVSFSPSGNKLAWVGHDSSISVVDATNGNKMAVVREKFLPFMSCIWINEQNLICVGYDCCPLLFGHDDDQLNFIKNLDVQKEELSTKQSAMQRFQDLDKKAVTADDGKKTLKTLHKNTVTQISLHTGSKSNCSKFSTSAVDGNLIIWDVK